MLSCFTYSKSESAIPIVPIVESQLDAWLSSQEERVQNWVKATGYRAKPGSMGLLCNTQGHLEKVLVGMSHAQDFAVFGALVGGLPKGEYRVEMDLQPQEHYRIFLAWGLASYQFTPYKKAASLEAKLYWPTQAGLDEAFLEAILRATYLIRDLINTPADDMRPADIAEAAVAVAEEFNADVVHKVGDELLQAGYPTVYAVGRGSPHAPHLVDIRWGQESHPKVTLVGKGVSFDSGGLDIKSAANMSLMKKDMAGAAHVIGLARVIMSLQLPIRLRVIIPTVENAVSGEAYHPGDVLVTRKGISVEVTNTDAEGRLILCDALYEAASEKPELLLDFATLTGAARVALGTDITALFTTNDQLALDLMTAGQEENDLLWRLPLHAPYRKLLESKIADLANAASSAYGGAITAAVFLKEFVPDDVPWVHFDMMAWNISSKMGLPEGGEATGLRAVAHYLCKRYR